MVYFFDLNSLGKTKKRLNRSTVDLNGEPQRNSILRKIKRRFSQSERDISSLDHQQHVETTDHKKCFDDNLIVYAIGKLTDNSRLKAKCENNEQFEQCNSTNHSSQKHQNGVTNSKVICHKFRTEQEEIPGTKEDLRSILSENETKETETVRYSYNKMEENSKANEEMIDSSLTEDEFVCIDLNANSFRSECNSDELQTPVESFLIENRQDHLLLKESTSDLTETFEQWNGSNFEILDEVDNKKAVLDETMNNNKDVKCYECDTHRPLKTVTTEEFLKNTAEVDVENLLCRKINNTSLSTVINDDNFKKSHDVYNREIKGQMKEMSIDDDENFIPNSKSRIHRKNGTCLSPPLAGTADDDATEWHSFDAVNHKRHRRTERLLSAPSLLQTMPNDNAHVDSHHVSNHERRRSLKSAMKRRSYSITSSTSLKVRFNLEEEASSKTSDDSKSEEQGKSKNSDLKSVKSESESSENTKLIKYGCANTTNSNEPKKKFKYVMRKFKLKQPLIDYTSTCDEATMTKAITSEKKNDVINNKTKKSCDTSFIHGAEKIHHQSKLGYIKMEYERNELAEEKSGTKSKKVEGKLVNDRIDLPSWSKPLPGTDKDGTSVPLLHIAAANGDAELLQTLINIGVDLNEKDEDGWPAIHYAIGRGYFECATLLIKYGADLNGYTDDIMKCYCKTVREVMIINDV